MRIKKIHIQNYKSLVDFELESPPPFCAFVGPNASGKSNIFEALEFTNYVARFVFEAPTFFGGKESFFAYNPIQLGSNDNSFIAFEYEFNDQILIHYDIAFSEKKNHQSHANNITNIFDYSTDQKMRIHGLSISDIRDIDARKKFIEKWKSNGKKYENDYEQFIDNFSRIFIGNDGFNPVPSINKLSFGAANRSQIIGQIFEDKNKKDDFIEWMQILIPEFERIEVKKNNIDGNFEYFIYEKSSTKPFSKKLISDGTKNILALLAAVYQSNTPQFLCIEEPENGLHPQAIELLVDFFREKCEDEGHHIWLTTHSPTLVRCMGIDEVVLVNKIDGVTRARIATNKKDLNIKTDEAWLTNSLRGGTLWSK